jgi:hypothetical protein
MSILREVSHKGYITKNSRNQYKNAEYITFMHGGRAQSWIISN